MEDEDWFDDLDETPDPEMLKDLEKQVEDLVLKNKDLEADCKYYVKTLARIRAYFEVRFSVLKESVEDGFLRRAFKELDNLQDCHDEIMDHLYVLFPNLQGIPQKDLPVAVIASIDGLMKSYSQLKSADVPQPAPQPSPQPDHAEDPAEQYKTEIAELKQRNVLLEEQVKAANAKPIEPLPSVDYQAEIVELKKQRESLEEQLRLARVKPIEPLPSVDYQAEIVELKKESEETKQRLETELQGKEQKLAELIAAHSTEITVLQQKLGKSDRVAMQMLGDNFAEYQNQSFIDDAAIDQWLTEKIHAGFVPINGNAPDGHENSVMHAIIRKKIKDFAQTLKPEVDRYIASVNNDRSALIRDVYTALMKHAGILIPDHNERITNLNNELDELGKIFNETGKIFNKTLNQYEYDELV